MQGLQFREIVDTVNRTGTVQIEPRPEEERQGLWTLHKGTLLHGGLKIHSSLLYIYADATREGLESAKEALQRLPVPQAQRQVVIAESKLQDVKELLVEFAPVCGSALSTPQYLRACIKQQLDVYEEGIRALPHAHYVPPVIEALSNPVGLSSQKHNALFESFANPERSTNSMIHVLVAEPGQGKTFFSKYLSVLLLKFGFVPLFVESRQWSGLTVDDLNSFWKTVAHTFRSFHAPIPISDGYEESFLRVCFKANLFRLVFDGFDEYVLKTNGNVDALEVLDNLQSMAGATGTPILITSRSSFWDGEVAPRLDRLGDVVRVFQMRPFTSFQAARYLEHRFPDNQDRVTRGVELFSQLKKKTSSGDVDFVGRGFFLPLLADLVQRASDGLTVELHGVTATQWIMNNLCDREIRAHRLPLTVEQQMSLFADYAQNILAGEAPTLENLRLVLETTPGLSRADVDALTGKASERSIRVHPLLKVDSASNEIVFASQQIFYSLLCDGLLGGCVENGNKVGGSLPSILSARKATPSVLSELAESLVDHVDEITDRQGFIASIHRVIASIKECEARLSTAHALNAPALISSIAVFSIARLFPPKAKKQDKTQALLELLGVKGFVGLDFMGTISGYDFRGAHFESCKFEGVTWFGCIFDANVKFLRCAFRSNRVLACDKFGDCEWTDCELDHLSAAAFRAEQITTNRARYTLYDLRHDLNLVVGKFVDGGRFREVREKDLTKGSISLSIHRTRIIDRVRLSLLDKHDASGLVSYSIKSAERAGVQFFLENGVPEGAIKSLEGELATSLNVQR